MYTITAQTTAAWAVRARAGRPEIRSVLAGARCEHMLTENDLQELGTVPILLVWGEHERVFSEADLAWFTQHLNAEHTTVIRPAGCGHIPFLDRCVLQFLRIALIVALPVAAVVVSVSCC